MSIARALFLLFIVLPLVDLWLLWQLGLRYGFVQAIGIALLVGAVGASIAKREGLRVIADWNRSLAAKAVPDEGVLAGVLSLGAAVFFIMPGVLSDVVGLFLVIPPTRRLVVEAIRDRFERGLRNGNVEFSSFGVGGFATYTSSPSGARPHDGPSFARGSRRGGYVGPRGDDVIDVIEVSGEDVSGDANAQRPRALPAPAEDEPSDPGA